MRCRGPECTRGQDLLPLPGDDQAWRARISRPSWLAGLVFLAVTLAPGATPQENLEPSPLTGESLTSAPEPKQLELSDHRVVLMFDDGWNSVFTHAYPLLKRHNMTPSLALISGAIGTANSTYASDPKSYMSRAQIQELIDSLDAEIVSHSHTHPFLTRLSDAAVRAELVQSKETLKALFGKEIEFFVYPYGDQDARIQRLVAEAGYKLARGIRPGKLGFRARAYNLPSTEVRMGTSLEEVKEEIVRRPDLILFFHRIVPNPSAFTEWSTYRFAGLLQWLAAKRVQVVTLAELYEPYQAETTEVSDRRTWRDRIEWDLIEHVDVNVTRTAEGR